MLERISWSTYWTVVVGVLAIYYTILLVLMYKRGFFTKVDFGTNARSSHREAGATDTPIPFDFGRPLSNVIVSTNRLQDSSNNEILMPAVHDLIDEIKAYITQLAQQSYIKEEVLSGLQIIVGKYPQLLNSAYYKSINDFIVNECEVTLSVRFSAEEVVSIWLRTDE